jgi:hypothetical protein
MTKYLKETGFSATLAAINPILTNLGLNSGRHSDYCLGSTTTTGMMLTRVHVRFGISVSEALFPTTRKFF